MKFLLGNVGRGEVWNPGISNMESIMPIKGLFRGFDFHIPSSNWSSSHSSLGRPAKFPGNLFSVDKWFARSTCFCLTPGITFSFTINWCINFLCHLVCRESTCAVCQGLARFKRHLTNISPPPPSLSSFSFIVAQWRICGFYGFFFFFFNPTSKFSRKLSIKGRSQVLDPTFK